MRDQLILLYELQQIDLKIRDLELQLDDLPQQALATKSELEKTQAVLTAALTRQNLADTTRRSLESELAADKEKLRKWEARLNDIRNSREFAALSREIEGLKRQIRGAEDKILEVMQEGEDINVEVSDLSSNVDNQNQTYNDLSTSAVAASKGVRAQVDKLQITRQALTAKIKDQLLKRYDSIRDHCHGIGLVIAADGACQGCHVSLPPQLYNEIQRGDHVETCPMCNRILYFQPLGERTVTEQSGVSP